MRGSHLTKEGWERADPQILRIVKSIENLKMDDNGDRYWTKSRDRKLRRRLEMNDPEKRKIENFDEFGIDRPEMDYDNEGESGYE